MLVTISLYIVLLSEYFALFFYIDDEIFFLTDWKLSITCSYCFQDFIVLIYFFFIQYLLRWQVHYSFSRLDFKTKEHIWPHILLLRRHRGSIQLFPSDQLNVERMSWCVKLPVMFSFGRLLGPSAWNEKWECRPDSNTSQRKYVCTTYPLNDLNESVICIGLIYMRWCMKIYQYN